MPLATLPQTVYAVAVLWMNHSRHVLSSQLFSVSGLNPLTDDEARARGVKMSEDTWDPDRLGPRSDYRLTTVSLSQFTQSQV